MTLNGADLKHPALHRRRRLGVRWWFVSLLVALTASACAGATVVAESARPEPGPTTMSDTAEQASQAEPTATPAGDAKLQDSPLPDPTPTPHPVAVADTELPPARIGFDELFDDAPAGPQPISIAIENIDVRDAAVIPVGVNDDLTFEVPPADQVGWYEFGSAPGEPGSAVLAAHIAYNGVDGVFRYLEEVEIGSVVIVGFDDGTSLRYRIEEVTEYVKEALPDSLFDRDGREQLALITCGGTFNYQLDSYESNTVAIAVPI